MLKNLIQKTYKYRLIIGLVILAVVLVILVLINENRGELLETEQKGDTTNSYQAEKITTDNQNREGVNENTGNNLETEKDEEDEYEVGGLTLDEIQSMGDEEYKTFVNGLTEGEKDSLPGKYSLLEYSFLENDYFKIRFFNELDMVLEVEIKGNEEESKKYFEDWFSKNVSTKRSDIEVFWINSNT